GVIGPVPYEFIAARGVEAGLPPATFSPAYNLRPGEHELDTLHGLPGVVLGTVQPNDPDRPMTPSQLEFDHVRDAALVPLDTVGIVLLGLMDRVGIENFRQLVQGTGHDDTAMGRAARGEATMKPSTLASLQRLSIRSYVALYSQSGDDLDVAPTVF